MASALAAAISANAWMISVAGDTNAVGTITTVDYKFSNLPGINAATFNFFTLSNPVTGDFTGNFTDGANVLNTAALGGNVSIASNTYAFSGVWTLQAGSNIPGVSKTGTYTALYDLNSKRYELNVAGAVPEPTSFAALGIGVVALARRRRR